MCVALSCPCGVGVGRSRLMRSGDLVLTKVYLFPSSVKYITYRCTFYPNSARERNTVLPPSIPKGQHSRTLHFLTVAATVTRMAVDVGEKYSRKERGVPSVACISGRL